MENNEIPDLPLTDVQAAFDAILAEFGPESLDDIIETTLARCAIKQSRRPHARLLLRTAFSILQARSRA